MGTQLERFVEIVRRLRDPEGGCPWDCRQTLLTLRRFLVEESGEYLEAVESGDVGAIREELGDLLLQVVLNAQVAADEGLFDLEDVARGIGDKMVRRHPHVFGQESGGGSRTDEELRQSWESIKRQEKGDAASASPAGAVAAVPRSLPGMLRAQKTLGRAERAGLSPAEPPATALSRVRAALSDVSEGLGGEAAESERRVGELLLSVARLCGSLGIQGEEAVQGAVARYVRRLGPQESV
ncbi:MAG: MazG family protein [Oligosphaeraceae bacterium]